jgi:hypothetical protein
MAVMIPKLQVAVGKRIEEFEPSLDRGRACSLSRS